MRLLKPLILSIFILLFFCACGQKGPLFLPDEQPPVVHDKQDDSDENDRDDDGGLNETQP